MDLADKPVLGHPPPFVKVKRASEDAAARSGDERSLSTLSNSMVGISDQTIKNRDSFSFIESTKHLNLCAFSTSRRCPDKGPTFQGLTHARPLYDINLSNGSVGRYNIRLKWRS
ncbi:MAG: hypothetical protein Q9191_001896 [Dirinaria sp. TL-2023a]